MKNIEALLNNPEIQSVISNINQELTERQKYSPPICDVFSSLYTYLETDDRYRFNIDREAQKKLPDIINNKVQKIVSTDSPDEFLKAEYSRKRNIGIVFSGGPASRRA